MLSSTMRISMGSPMSLAGMSAPPFGGNGERERGAVAGFGLHPDAPADAFDDLLAHRQADPRPRVLLARVETLEHLEDAVRVLGIDADPVVAHREHPLVRPPANADVHL